MKSTRTSRWIPTSLALLPLLLAAACAEPLAGMEKEVKPTDLEALKAAGAKANGLVAWTSSRDGLPHIYTMKTDGSDTRQLTKGDATDWRPRFSPDGAKILFQRSRESGFVSESAANVPGAWDLYTIGIDGTGLTKVVPDATWGSWAGPDEIVFVRGSKIMRSKPGAEDATKIMDTSRYALFDGVAVQQPELSHDGHFLALTLTGQHREAGIWNIKKKVWTQLGQGGQIAWAPDGASVYWADDSGKEGSRIAREPVVAGTPADERDPAKLLLVDLPGKRSRERFPRLSRDGKWLVFGAAITSLQNDVEDYELYLWEAGSPATSATRLTFHSANDRWPDVFTGSAPAPAEEQAKDAPEEGDKAERGATSDAGTKAEPAADEPQKAPAADAEESEEGGTPPASTSKPKPKKKKHR